MGRAQVKTMANVIRIKIVQNIGANQLRLKMADNIEANQIDRLCKSEFCIHRVVHLMSGTEP